MNGNASPSGAAIDTRDLFSVVSYGADILGVVDSTTATREAITAAAANVASTGRRSVVYWPAGDYSYRTRSTRRHLDVNNLTNVVFLGAPGRRSILRLNGDSQFGDWYLFNVRGGSGNIEFRDLVLDMTGIINPDPAEQNHLIARELYRCSSPV